MNIKWKFVFQAVGVASTVLILVSSVAWMIENCPEAIAFVIAVLLLSIFGAAVAIDMNR